MLAPFPFAVHAGTGCPGHAELALSLAASFHDVDPEEVDSALEVLADGLALPASGRPLGELLALADAVLPFPPDERTAGTDPLLLDRALITGRADPLIATVIAAEAARRRGVGVGIVSNGSDHFLAHHGVDVPLLLDIETAMLVDAHRLEPTLTWRCAHETCGLALDELERRWPQRGRPDLALRAAELRLFLPLEEESKKLADRKLVRARSRFN